MSMPAHLFRSRVGSRTGTQYVMMRCSTMQQMLFAFVMVIILTTGLAQSNTCPGQTENNYDCKGHPLATPLHRRLCGCNELLVETQITIEARLLECVCVCVCDHRYFC